MKVFVAAIIGLLVLVMMPAMAVQENVSLDGKYVVSFDTGLSPSNYTIHVMPARKETGFIGTRLTYHYLWLNQTTSRQITSIGILEYDTPVSAGYSRSIMENDLQKLVPLGFSDPLIMDRVIDNTSGIVGRTTNPTRWMTNTEIRYPLNPEENGSSREIVSVRTPSDPSIENIIDTIHVTKTDEVNKT